MKKVFLVEFRMNHLLGNKDYIECMTLHIASSLEKALEFCKKSTRCHDHTRATPWWFVISEEDVDCSDVSSSKVVTILDWNAKEIQEQPVYGYYNSPQVCKF